MSNLLFLYILLIIVVTLFNVFSWGSSILHLERCFHVFESKICGHGLLIHRTSQLIQCGMDKGVTGQEFSSLKSTSSQRKNEGRVWAAMTFVALLRPGAIQFQFHYNSFQLWEACAKIALKWSLLFPLFCAPFACPALTPDFQSLTRQACRQGTCRVLPGLFPPLCPLDWGGRGGLAFMEMNGWRNQNLNRLYCAGASKGAVARQGLWSWGKHRRRKRLVWGGEHPCSWPHKKTLSHRCMDVQCVDVDILYRALPIASFTQACIVTWGTCGAVLFDAHLCLYLRRSHTVTCRSGRFAAV